MAFFSVFGCFEDSSKSHFWADINSELRGDSKIFKCAENLQEVCCMQEDVFLDFRKNTKLKFFWRFIIPFGKNPSETKKNSLIESSETVKKREKRRLMIKLKKCGFFPFLKIFKIGRDLILVINHLVICPLLCRTYCARLMSLFIHDERT